MNSFWSVFLAVFLAELASLPVKRYFTPNAEKVLSKIELLLKGVGK